MPRQATEAECYQIYLAAEAAIRDAIDALAEVSNLGAAFSAASCIVAGYAAELHDEANGNGTPSIAAGTVH